MKNFVFIAFLLLSECATGQELYPISEPASTLSAKSIALRMNNQLFPHYDASLLQHRTTFRLNPEVGWGIYKKLTAYFNFYGSTVHQNNFKIEGSSVYVKYRFYSRDDVHYHFRMALYGMTAISNNPVQYEEMNLAGDNSGVTSGVIATQLLHKVALSFTGGYLHSFNNVQNKIPDGFAKDAITYSLSTGYLFLPFHFKNYEQPNVNLYTEFIGKTYPATKESYMDIAPSLQVILKSVGRIDFVYQKQIYGNMTRINNTMFAIRFEYNWLNAYR